MAINKNIKLMIETQTHDSKPTDTGLVRNNLINVTIDNTEELAHYLVNEGRTMQANATCHDGSCKGKDWRSQEIFALDIDNDPPKDIAKAHKDGKMSDAEYNEYLHTDYPNKVTPDQIIERCHSYGLNPCFVYGSFSDTEYRRKFRLVFRSNTVITIPAIRRAIIHAMRVIVPESDRMCIDSTRVFFGGKSLIYTDYDATFNPIALITQAMPMYLKNHDSVNQQKNLAVYCKTAGLNICNGLPDIRPTTKDKYFCECIASKKEENSANSIYNNIEFAVKSSKNNTDNFDWAKLHSNEFADHVLYQDWRTAQYYDFNFAKPEKIKTNKKGETKVTYSVEKRKESYNEDLIRNFDFQALNDNCRLVREINNHEYWATHDILFGIGSNYACIEGGDGEFEELVDNNVEGHEYAYSGDNISGKYKIPQYARKMGYCPARCENFCPYKDECQNQGLNMLSAIPKKINNKIRKTSDTIEYISREQAEQDTMMAISEALNAHDNKIHCIKAPTGIGKTRMYTQENLENVCVALPTHDLKDEVYNRIVENNPDLNIVCKQRFDSPSANLNTLYAQWSNTGADVLSNLKAENVAYKNCKDTREYIDSYIKNVESLKTATTVVTTHANMLHLNNPNLNTYIIDEDITQSLLSISEYSRDDINALIHQLIMDNGSTDDTVKQLRTLDDTITCMNSECYQIFPSIKITGTKKIKSAISNIAGQLKTNIPEIITSDFMIKTYDPKLRKERILCAKSNLNLLKNDKTYIILSATLDKDMCELLFKDRLIYTDIGAVKIDTDEDNTTGIIYQWCKYSTSREAIRKNPDRTIDFITTQIPDIDKHINMITFADAERTFKQHGFDNQICHFGACSGIDAYGGQDLLIVGTPHINMDTYILYSLMLGRKVSSLECDDDEMSRQNINRNGYEFTFMTFENKFLQTIQIWAIEQELYQAIGRARAIRNKCNVYIFSNLPLVNTKIQDK